MKKTLREKLWDEIDKIDKRCNQLMRNISEYKEDNDFENAMKNDIKLKQLEMVAQHLSELLKES
jgi:hypothetical protein